MSRWIYLSLIVGLVPLQSTLLYPVGIAGIRPDLCLIATGLVGILRGEREGTLLGLALGFMQDLFSPGGAWLNTLTKGVLGLLAGIAARHLASTTPTAIGLAIFAFSMLSSLIFLLTGWADLEAAELFVAVRALLLPQALLDGLLAVGVSWVITRRGSGRFTGDVLRLNV